MTRSCFERELRRGLLECVARMCIGLSDKVWIGAPYFEIYFLTEIENEPDLQ